MPVSNNETVIISTDHVNVRGIINQEAYEFESIILLKNVNHLLNLTHYLMSR